MNIFEAINNRRSVRKFTDEPVSDADLSKILDSANRAPSASNKQPWRFIVIKNKNLTDELSKLVHQKLEEVRNKAQDEHNQELLDRVDHYKVPFTFFSRAPITVAVVLTPYNGTGMAKAAGVDDSKYNSASQSVAAAIQNFLLAAHALNYGSCWMTGPLIAHKKMSRLLHIADDEQLMALLPLGRFSLYPKPKEIKSWEELTTFIE